jgi:hypothetical protein
MKQPRTGIRTPGFQGKILLLVSSVILRWYRGPSALIETNESLPRQLRWMWGPEAMTDD